MGCSMGAGCAGLHAGQDVLVGVDGEHRCRVAEAFAHNLDGDAGSDQQRAVRVAQVVQADYADAGSAGDALEALRDRMGWMSSPCASVNTHPAAAWVVLGGAEPGWFAAGAWGEGAPRWCGRRRARCATW
jgi:hypothetical protein